MTALQFKPLSIDDIELLYTWFQEPTTHKWYTKGISWLRQDLKQKDLPRTLETSNVPSFIVYSNEQPTGIFNITH